MKELEQITKLIFKETKIIKIILQPKLGATIDDTIDEAILASTLFKCDVEFTHNGEIHTVSFKNLQEVVKKKGEM